LRLGPDVLDNQLANLVRDYRDAAKRRSTYWDGWASEHVATDGRIYPRWVQLGANSGRMACSSPNMQNLPRGEYRKCFAAPPGRVLVKADYSRIELRIAAKVSGDRERASLSRFVRGERSLRLDMADRLAKYFGLELTPTARAGAPKRKRT
jgi:DNA polymerase I-like protein with 3'-5' exonuclease and polymerase domains